MSTPRNIKIIHKNSNFLAVNKPAGVLVHPAKPDDEDNTLTSWLVRNFPETKNVGDRPDWRPGIVHRLDRDTSGILILARTQKFFEYFKNLLKERKVKKSYLALLWGKIEKEGKVDKPIGLKPNTTRWSTRGKNLKMIKEALTIYKPLEIFKKGDDYFTLTKLYPKTGRTHQLRVHMASLHRSVVGDKRYGRKGNPLSVDRQFLHAQSIKFKTMKDQSLKLEAPLTEDLQEVLESLKN